MMVASSSPLFTTPFRIRIFRLQDVSLLYSPDFAFPKRRRLCATDAGLYCSSPDSLVSIRKSGVQKTHAESCGDSRFDLMNASPRLMNKALPSTRLSSSNLQCCLYGASLSIIDMGNTTLKMEFEPVGAKYSPFFRRRHQSKHYPRCTPGSTGPQSRDTPPKRDTGIANEKDWGISLLSENVNESGTNEDGSTWYRESGEDLGENGYRCRWTRMGGRSSDGSSEWKETWWEKSDWTGHKELGVEKSGNNAEGDAWWETWQEVLHQDEWRDPPSRNVLNLWRSNIARIERSAEKQAKSGLENAGWYEKWWEKYDAKGWTEKGAHKYGRLNEQSWWEKWGEHYDGKGSVLKWTDKWAETEVGTKWGDKWEEKFYSGIGSRQGETWHVSPTSERWSRTWGEEHFGNGKVHKYGKSTTGESWDIAVDEGTYYEAEPHYGWADVVGDSTQLLSIQPLERPPGIYPDPPPPPPDVDL